MNYHMYEILINTYAILTTKYLDKKWETVKKKSYYFNILLQVI